jgi:hypothetical protein
MYEKRTIKPVKREGRLRKSNSGYEYDQSILSACMET